MTYGGSGGKWISEVLMLISDELLIGVLSQKLLSKWGHCAIFISIDKI